MAMHPLVASQRAKEAVRLIQQGDGEVGFQMLLQLLKENPQDRSIRRALTLLAMNGELKRLQIAALRAQPVGVYRAGKFILPEGMRKKTGAH